MKLDIGQNRGITQTNRTAKFERLQLIRSGKEIVYINNFAIIIAVTNKFTVMADLGVREWRTIRI